MKKNSLSYPQKNILLGILFIKDARWFKYTYIQYSLSKKQSKNTKTVAKSRIKNAEFRMTKTRHFEILYSIIKGIVNFKNLLLLPIADKLPGVNKLYRRSRCKFTATFSWLPEKRHWWTFQLRFNAWKRYHDERTTGICRCKCTLSYPFSFPIRLLCIRVGMVLR